MLKPATDLAKEKPAVVTERLAVGNEKPTFHSIKVVTCASNLATQWNGYWIGQSFRGW